MPFNNERIGAVLLRGPATKRDLVAATGLTKRQAGAVLTRDQRRKFICCANPHAVGEPTQYALTRLGRSWYEHYAPKENRA